MDALLALLENPINTGKRIIIEIPRPRIYHPAKRPMVLKKPDSLYTGKRISA